MTNAKRSMRLAIAALVLSWLMTGCSGAPVVEVVLQDMALRRPGTLDVRIAYAQPSANDFVKLTEIRDVRRFEADPRRPSVPSMQDAAETKDSSITSRALGRKRDPFGGAAGDILLPEGRTVQQVVREAMTRAVGELGYLVVDKQSPEFDKALPLQVDIEQFWGWFSGLWAPSFEFESILLLKSEALIGGVEARVRGYFEGSGYDVHDVMQFGIAELIEKVKVTVKRAIPHSTTLSKDLGAHTKGRGRIIFYRPSGFYGYAMRPDILLNGRKVGVSVPGTKFYVDTTAGVHRVSIPNSLWSGERILDIAVSDGQVIYVRTSLGATAQRGRTDIELVDSRRGTEDTAQLTLAAPE